MIIREKLLKKEPEIVCNWMILKYYFVNLFWKIGIIIAIKLSKQEAKMEHVTEVIEEAEIEVIEQNGLFMVTAELEDNFVFVPHPKGKMSVVFWDERCLKLFLESYGFVPVIVHKN